MAEAAFETVPVTTTSSAENVEITLRSTPEPLCHQLDERVEIFGKPFVKGHGICAAVAILCLVVGSVCFYFYVSDVEKNPQYIAWIIGALVLFSCSVGAIATSRGDIPPRSRVANVTQNDVEGQIPIEASAQLLPGPSGYSAQFPPSIPSFSGSSAEPRSETSSSCGTASEKRSLLDSDEEPSSKVTAVSEVASAFVEIAKRAATVSDEKEATTAEAEEASEETSTVEKQVVGETSEPGQNSESESELTSSGEVRRRNISGQSSVVSKRSSKEVQQSSSDEEAKQE